MSRKDAIEILCCPFCGGQAEVRKHGIHTNRWCVRCNTDICNYTWSRPAQAIAAWNRRTALESKSYPDTTEAKEILNRPISTSITERSRVECLENKIIRALAALESKPQIQNEDGCPECGAKIMRIIVDKLDFGQAQTIYGPINECCNCDFKWMDHIAGEIVDKTVAESKHERRRGLKAKDYAESKP